MRRDLPHEMHVVMEEIGVLGVREAKDYPKQGDVNHFIVIKVMILCLCK